MAKPVNPILVELFGRDLTTLDTPATDVYVVTNQIMVPAGTDFEQLMADMMTGKFANDPAVLQTVATSVVDITKVA